MAISRKGVRNEAVQLFFFLLISILQAYLMCRSCEGFKDHFPVIVFVFLMWILLWKGNDYLSHVNSRMVSWIEFPVKRFVVGIVTTIVYTVGILILLIVLFEKFFGLRFGDTYNITIYVALVITFLISLFLHGREFLMHWRQASLERAKYEKESIAAKYESLKSQVNPHFLFNSLNALTNLVYQDQDKAAKFIKQLSDVYRYVLDTRDTEVVSLDEELKFLNAYVYLQQIRFGDKLKIEIQFNQTSAYVTPLALQMLIENAIKHNVIAEDQPLKIRVYAQDGYIIVENNLQKKTTDHEPSSGVGLENIFKRYALLSDRKVEILNQEDRFVVKLPELKNVTA